jgi:uncharacterized protein YkwD
MESIAMSLNNQLKTAKQLRPLSGSNRVYSGKTGGKDPDQFYRLRLNRSSNLDLSLTGGRANTNLALLNGNGKVLSRTVQNKRSNGKINQILEKGTYYVRVNRRQGSTRYQLSLRVANMPAPSGLPQPKNLSAMTKQVIALTNFHRQQAGLSPLQANPVLAAVAQSHTENMIVKDFYAHQDPSGLRASDRIRQAGYSYQSAAENIGVGFSTAEGVVQAWMNSPGHRANILNPILQEIGVGFYFMANDPGSTNYRYYWTQNFGTPAR